MVGGTPGPATIVISVNGVNITADVEFLDAEFVSYVNGLPGSCSFRVRDVAHTYSFSAGESIAVDINGVREWAGYVMRAHRKYAFSAQDTSSTVTRFIAVEGVDLNILFRKRIAFNKLNPVDVTGGTYHYAGTPVADTTAITDLITNYLDLSGDSLDVASLVQNVGNINVDQDVNAFAGSWTWEQAMSSIAMLPAAIYYIDPYRKLVYTDVDTVSAPFALSDQPDNSSTFGYREMEVVLDGSNLINDYMAWGVGTGSASPVFSRLTDSASVALHGLWQDSSLGYDVYKQGTVDRIANSWVYGSPSSHRGHKDDKPSATITTFWSGLRAGMKVSFTSNVYGFSDVIPIRQFTLSFVNPTHPQYKLVLSHAIDSPWSFFDIYNPRLPGLTPTRFSVPGIGGFKFPDLCGITDTFTRTSATTSAVIDNFNRTVSGMGVASSGSTWDLSSNDGTWSVDGMAHASVTANQDAYAILPGVAATDITVSAQLVSGAGADDEITFGASNTSSSQYVYLRLTRSGNVTLFGSMGNFFLTGSVGFGAATAFKMRIKVEAGAAHGKLWIASGPEPAGWTIERTFSPVTLSLTRAELDVYSRFGTIYSAQFDNLLGATTTANGWGISDAGIPWEVDAGSTGTATVDQVGTLSTAPAAIPANSTGEVLVVSIPTPDAVVRFRANHVATDMTLPPGGLAYSEDTFYAASMVFSDGSTEASVAVRQKKVASGVTSTLIEFFKALPSTFETIICPITLVAGAWYHLRLLVTPSAPLEARIWADADPEPTSWLTTVMVAPAATSYAAFRLGHASPFALFTDAPTGLLVTDFDDLSINGICGIVTVDTRTSGEGRISTNGGPNPINLGSPYWIGTTRVWVNGLAQRLGIDYTESDWSSGGITFVTPTTAGDNIVATFVGRTPLGGGATKRVL